MAIKYILETPSKGNMKFNERNLIITGWAYSDNSNLLNVKISSSDIEIPVKSHLIRQDVFNFYRNGLNSGFYAEVSIKTIKKAKYKLNIILESDSEKEVFLSIDLDSKVINKQMFKTNKLVKKLHVRILYRGLKFLINYGFFETLKKVKFFIKKKYFNRICKKKWDRRNSSKLSPLAFGCSKAILKYQNKYVFSSDIKFSILVPLFNTPKSFLEEMISSVLIQTYSNWELCLADGSDEDHSYVKEICKKKSIEDQRIKYVKLEKNLGISENTNACIKMATGDYISLFDHDDLLHPCALFETMKAICEQNAEFIYTDEATFESPDLHKIIHTNFKPDYAPDYFNGCNYICHFTSFKRSLLDKVGVFNSECDGAQDYDMFLRLIEQIKDPNKIYHIKKCLYFWRASLSSTASGAEAKNYTTVAGQKALQNHFNRIGVEALVMTCKIPNAYRIKYPINGNPLISILIPNYDHWKTLKKCIDSIEQISTYKNFEIIIIENNSVEKETFEYYESLKNHKNIKIVCWKGKFNHSAINNYGVKFANGEYLLLLNNDVEVITPSWIEELLMFAQRKDVGAVGAMLYYPSNKIQHAGVVLGIGGVAGHAFYRLPKEQVYYNGRNILVNNYSCVTAACLMVSSEIYNEVNGFDETFEVDFNDVDLCMKIRKAGYLNIWTPFAELYHYESESRGFADTPEKQRRFEGEVNRFKLKWYKELKKGDPFYNPNLTLNKNDFSKLDDVIFYFH